MGWDLAWFEAINGLAGRAAWLDGLMLLVTRPGNLVLPVGLMLGYWVWTTRREAVIGAPVLLALIGFADFIGAQLKHAVGRPRPCAGLLQIQDLVGCGGTFTFPSNHAVNTAAAAAFLQVLYPNTGWVAWPVVLLIGVSRVYVGAHFPTDVLAGWLLGGLLGLAVAVPLSAWQRFRRQDMARGTRQGARV
ncbi:MAG: phosphatase PAP2 family protein [Nitrospirales bacterium]